MPAQTVWGLDIGESGLKAVKVARGRKFLEVVRVDLIPIKAPVGPEEAAVDRETLVTKAVEEFVRRHDPSDSRIVASVQGRSTFCKPITLAPVETKRIPEIVRLEVKQQIPFPIEDIVWDYFKCKDAYAPGEEIEVNLVAIRKEIVENFTEMFTRAGIRVDVLQAAPLALYNLVKYEFAPEGNVVIIDIGAEITDLVIVEGDRFWPRTLPIAGKQITKALEEKFEIPFDQAEKLKLGAADSKNYQQIFGAVRPVLKELVGEIHRTIGYYKSLSKEVTFDKIIFMGNATKLAGFEKFFGENLPYEIEVVQGLENLRVSRRLNLTALRDYLPAFAVALGLAIQGLGEGKCNVNLLPEEIRGKMRPGKLFALIGAAALVLLAFPAGMVIAGIAKEMSARLAGTYDAIPGRVEQPASEVKKNNDIAAAAIAEGKKIQQETEDKYLYYYRTVRMPGNVMEEIGKVAPRNTDVLEVTDLDAVPKDLTYNRDGKIEQEVRLIRVEYIEESTEKTEVAAGGGKNAPAGPVRKRSVTVTITGLTNTVNGSLTDTRIWVEKNFADKLNGSKLSVTVEANEKAASASAEYMTDNYWNDGAKSEGISRGQYTVFKISWRIDPDSEHAPGNE